MVDICMTHINLKDSYRGKFFPPPIETRSPKAQQIGRIGVEQVWQGRGGHRRGNPSVVDQEEQTLPPLLCRLQSKHEQYSPDPQPWLSLQNVDRAT